MASTKLELSSRINSLGESELLIRVTVRRGLQPRLHTGLYIRPERLRGGKITFPRVRDDEYNRLLAIEEEMHTLIRAVIDAASSDPQTITKEQLLRVITNIKSDKPANRSGFYELWVLFLRSRDISEHRKKTYQSVVRALHRFEIYKQLSIKKYRLSLDDFSKDTINEFIEFLKIEYTLPEAVTSLFSDFPPEIRPQHKTHRASPRGNNAISDIIKRLAAFFNWCNRNGYTSSRPFDHLENRPRAHYGTPFYLTTEERDIIANFDLSHRPALAAQRDIFIFQCLTGCRVGDLKKLTSSNIVGGVLEYVAGKTIKERPRTIRVPLNDKAREIVSRYRDAGLAGKLLPFISEQRYNDAIKEICRICGIDRVVTVINSVTGRDERRPIYEIATSHMARRTFIGNLYKKVKDPNLIGVLSGHIEGSRAFTRYRDIDDEIKRDVIDLL